MADRPKQLSNMTDEERRKYVEPGAEEDTYTPGGILEPDNEIGRLGKLFRGAAMVVGGTRVARMAADETAPVARKFTLEQLRKTVSPEKLDNIANEVRLQGYSHIKGPNGELLGTVGEVQPGEFTKYARDAVSRQEAAAPTIVKGESIEGTTSYPLKQRGPKGEAAEYMERTGIDPRNKSAVQTMEELRKKQEEERTSLLSRIKKPE